MPQLATQLFKLPFSNYEQDLDNSDSTISYLNQKSSISIPISYLHQMIITLIGFMGSGKSSIGRELADILSWNCIDLDYYIEDMERRSITTIFEKEGEASFRAAESKYLKELLDRHHNLVLALGGGAACQEQNWKLIQQSTSIYLYRSNEDLFQKLNARKAKRPLIASLNDKHLREYIKNSMEIRSPYYSRATYRVHVQPSKVKTAKQISQYLLGSINR